MGRFMRGNGLIIALWLASALLAGCNFPGYTIPTRTGPEIIYTLAAMTLQAEKEIALGTPHPTTTFSAPPGVTIQPVKTGTPANNVPNTTPASTQDAAQPCDRASFIADITVPDDVEIPTSTPFIKVWRITNNGSCPWTTGYAMIFSNGYSFASPSTVPLPRVIAPGETVDISLPLITPPMEGNIQGDWKLRNASGQDFGFGSDGTQTIWVKINVVKK